MDNQQNTVPIATTSQAELTKMPVTIGNNVKLSRLGASKNAAPATGMFNKPLYILRDFLTQSTAAWIASTVGHLFGKKHAYVTYLNNALNVNANGTRKFDGVYTLRSHIDDSPDSDITIAITADWATNTPESIGVSMEILAKNPDYTVHLGDTYYTGTQSEIMSNYIVPGAPWPKGPCGSFSLLGNHEMYSGGGSAYFDVLLKTLGITDKTTGLYTGQMAPFFCLQTNFWNVIALDTGYNCSKFPLPSIISGNCELPAALIAWLTGTVDLQNDKRGIIFLPHHQYCSAFEDQYFLPGEQLADIIGSNRKVLWIWGHEHRFAAYGRFQSKNKGKTGVSAYGRCIGQGGTPVEINTMIPARMSLLQKKAYNKQVLPSNLVICDYRYRKSVTNPSQPVRQTPIPLGFNGYATLTLQKELATISYYTIADNAPGGPPVLTEQWVSIMDGQISGKGAVNNVVNNDAFMPINNRPVTDIVFS